MPAAQLSMSFVPVGGKTLGIQIATSGKARLLGRFSVPYLASCGWNSYPFLAWRQGLSVELGKLFVNGRGWSMFGLLNKKLVMCSLLLLPLCAMAVEHPVSQADLSAYKELAQTRLDAAKESLQKDRERIEARLDSQDKRVGDIGLYLMVFGTLLTVVGLAVGFVGYFTVSSRAEKEARLAAAKWMEQEGRVTLEAQIKEFGLHIASEKQAATKKREELDDEIDALRPAATSDMAEQQKQLGLTQKLSDSSSSHEQASSADTDAIGKLVNALKRKAEAEYGFDDWNARAHDAYPKGKHEQAAEYWLQAVAAGGATRIKVAQALFNAGLMLGKLGRSAEAIEVYNKLDAHYGSATDVTLREQVAMALVNKGDMLTRLNRSEEAIALYDDVMARHGSATEAVLKKIVSNTQNSKGYTLLCRAKANWNDKADRLSNLQAATALFSQAVNDSNDNKQIVLGNQAYTACLLGQPDIARTLLNQALQQGGEKLYKATLGDLDIHPVPPDTGFRALLEELWAEVSARDNAPHV